jgi:serine/threonine protein kinase
VHLDWLTHLTAHKHAYEDAGILHCDISAGNIIITDKGSLLIDWDLCNQVENLENGARQSQYTVSQLLPNYDIRTKGGVCRVHGSS